MNDLRRGLRQNSFSITCITQWRNLTVHCVKKLYCINIATKLSLKVKPYFQSYSKKARDNYFTLDPHGT